MTRYVALMRGINISGKNKIAMPELKKSFEREGFSNVSTYINSGNILFDFAGSAEAAREAIELMTFRDFDIAVPTHVVEFDHLKKVLDNAPDWWGSSDKDTYDNLIFILSGESPYLICDLIGEPTSGLEQIEVYDDVIFWTFDLKAHAKCNWWKKTAAAGIGEKLTIRTAGTVRKLSEK